MKNKIVFLAVQYGLEVNGGAEIHCRMIAERLAACYDVEVFTSKFINYKTFEPFYKNDVDILNGVTIRRFDNINFDKNLHDTTRRRTKFSRKLRRNLFRAGALEFFSNRVTHWNFGIDREINMLKAQGFYSPSLLDFLSAHEHEYKAIISFSYCFPHTIFGCNIAPQKTILVPTVHNEGDLFRSIQTKLFSGVKHIAFNTPEEEKLARRVFGNKMAPSSIVGVGVDVAAPAPKTVVTQKYNLPQNYILYFGRVCESKMGNLIGWFLDYKKKHPGDVKLVLTGRIFMQKKEHNDIVYTGFVSEEEKTALILNSKLVVNPSKNESLSLLLLETMWLGKTLLVNGKSDVMKQHCIKSGHAAQYYVSKNDFIKKLHHMLSNTDIAETSRKAKAYVEENYNWEIIIKKYRKLIDSH